jgi:hypothetical protein
MTVMPETEEPAAPPNLALKEALAWISKFAHAWKAIEPSSNRLNIDGFIMWGPVLYEKHGHDDPVQLARQLFGSSGTYARYLYPQRHRSANEAQP